MTKTDRLIGELSKNLVSYDIGSRFMSDNDVCKRYKISLPVARSALAAMAQNGLIRRVAAKGTYVLSHSPAPRVNRSFKIAVFSCIGQWFPHANAVRMIEQYLLREGHDLVILNNGYEHSRPQNIDQIALMIEDALNKFDGVIWISAHIDEQPVLPDILRRHAGRVAFINLLFSDRLATCVMRDDRAGEFALTTHLARQGHRRIAFLGGPENRFMCHMRWEGFRAALLAENIPLDERYIKKFQPEVGFETGRQNMDELLRLPERPTACACIVDIMALGALASLREHGLQSPADMALTGFDNYETPSLPAVLTTADLALDEIGRMAAMHLTNQLNDRARAGTILYVPCPILIRSSTDAGRKPEIKTPLAIA